MAKISVERTIGQTKKAVLGGLLGYNAEKMGRQKYKRFAISLASATRSSGGCRRSLDHGAVYPILLDGAETPRPRTTGRG